MIRKCKFMIDENVTFTPAEKKQKQREIRALQKRIKTMHDIRDKMNRALSHVTDVNLDLALTQKKNLKLLSREYDKLVLEVNCLSMLDAAQVLEAEYNYILTIGNILETTRELKKNQAIDNINRAALIDGLTKFYAGLRSELTAAASASKEKPQA